MLLDINKLPRDVRWMCGSDFMLMITAAKYCEEFNKSYIYLSKEFKDYCRSNGLRLELSTMNQKFTYFSKCMIAHKLSPKKFMLDDRLFVK